MRRGRLPLAPTPAAWRLGLIGLGLIGAAFNTGNNLIYLMFSLLAGAVAVSAVLALRAGRSLRLELRLPAAPTVGAPFTVELRVTNTARRTALRAVDVELVTDQGRLGPVFFEHLAPGEQVGLAFPARGERRGALRIVEAMWRSSYPLGLVARRGSWRVGAELTVLPRSGPAARPAPQPRSAAGESATSAAVAGTEYRGLRRGGDDEDLRRIDWKVTARRGVMIVRETAGEARVEVKLSLTTRLAGEPAATRRSFERSIERVAGVARQVLRDGGALQLSIDGALATAYSGAKDLPRLLTKLATIEPTGADGMPLPPAPAAPGSSRPTRDAVGLRGSAAGRMHRLSTLAALAVGILAAVSFEAIGLGGFTAIAASAGITAIFPGTIAAASSLAGRAWRCAAVAGLAVFLLDLLWLRRDLLAGSSDLLVFVTLLALFNARSAEDDRRLLLISFVHVLLAASLTTELAFIVPLGIWLLCAIHASMLWATLPVGPAAARRDSVLDTRPARLRYAAPAAALAPGLALAAAIVFVLVPHFGTGTFRPTTLRPQSVSGFSDTASLGDIGRIKLDDTKVMEVEVEGAEVEELRWRGVVLSRFDGRSWSRGPAHLDRVRAERDGSMNVSGGTGWSADPAGRRLTQRVRLEPNEEGLIFAAPRARRIESSDFEAIGEDAAGNLQLLRSPGRRLAYTVVSELAPRADSGRREPTGDDDGARPADLELPTLDPRIPELARSITAGTATPYAAAAAIESWLSTRLEYSLDVQDTGFVDPLARFLFDGAPAHCEYFATAMVVLARSSGIPARFVAGYLPGEKSRFGRRYVVRQSDAHSWVEVHLAGTGWVTFDPTPPAGREPRAPAGLADLVSFLYSAAARLWDDHVVGLDLDDQGRRLFALLEAMRSLLAAAMGWSWSAWAGGLGLAASCVGLVLALRWLHRRLPRQRTEPGPTRQAPDFYLQALALLRERGFERGVGETALELQGRAGAGLGARGAERLAELTRLYHRVRFDGSTAERSVHRIARALLEDVRDELAPHPATTK